MKKIEVMNQSGSFAGIDKSTVNFGFGDNVIINGVAENVEVNKIIREAEKRIREIASNK
jgi:hypothetical protein